MFVEALILFYKANMHKSQMVSRGCSPQLQFHCVKVTSFTLISLPLRYLDMAITANRLSKLDCRNLLDKIRARIKVWSSRHVSYASQTVLINSALFSMYTFWGSIFILPQEVVEQVTKACRNY